MTALTYSEMHSFLFPACKIKSLFWCFLYLIDAIYYNLRPPCWSAFDFWKKMDLEKWIWLHFSLFRTWTLQAPQAVEMKFKLDQKWSLSINPFLDIHFSKIKSRSTGGEFRGKWVNLHEGLMGNCCKTLLLFHPIKLGKKSSLQSILGLFTAKRKLERLQFSTSSSFVKIWSACSGEFKAYFSTFWTLYHLLFDLETIGVN